MEWIQKGLLILLGFCGGVGIAGGIFAFISILGIVPRLVARLHLAKYIYWAELLIAFGGVTGSCLSIFRYFPPVGIVGIGGFGLFSGIFTGVLIMALAESLQVLPILAKRTNLRFGFPILIVALGLGKALGSLYQMILCR